MKGVGKSKGPTQGSTKLPPLSVKAVNPARNKKSGEIVPSANNNVKSVGQGSSTNYKEARKPPAKLEGLQKKGNVKTKGVVPKQKALPSIKSAVQVFDEVLQGCMSSVPPIPSTDVRLFISSTFADMTQERNWLATLAYPELKQRCEELGLDFRVIDMRWGILDTMTNDHLTEKLCLQEIENCQRISLGPNFVSILGDRYGYRPIPTEINEFEFDALCQEARAEDKSWPLKLKEWYYKDENAIPPAYVLQPITTKFKFFGDYSNEEKRKTDSSAWWEEFGQLQKILRQAAAGACDKALITPVQKHEYFKSVTECEVEAGIVEVTEPLKHTIGYARRFQGLVDNRLDDEKATTYTDTTSQGGKKKVDTDVAQYRQSLFNDKVKAFINENTRKSYVTWQSGGIDPGQHQEHMQYIGTFCRNFVEDTMKLVSVASLSKAKIIPRSEYYSHYEEILHHMHFCEKKCETFCGQEDILQQTKQFLTQKHRMPLVIYAESGVGKTSVMAMIMKKLKTWFGPNCVTMVRFLGTSTDSFNIFDVLFGICGQLADICDKIMEPEGYKNMKSLLAYFPRFLRNVSRHLSDQEVFILVDSLDQLSSAHQAHLMNWVETSLPSNIHFIYSTLPREHGCLDNLRKILPNSECFKELKAVPVTTGQEILDMHIRHHKRSVSEQQQEFLNSILSHNPTPLLLKIIADQAALWKSYTPMEELILAPTVKQAITHVFQDMEAKFGKLLVEKSLAYLTCGLNGLSETELEDALSCNNEVLADVYQYHNPPEENSIRIPTLLWARIHHDISEYLIERKSQGKTTYYWYHRQFIEVATERYVSANKHQIHKELAEIYMATEPITKTIHLAMRNLTMKDVDRRVTLQPATRKNVRRLACLMHHLQHSGDMDMFKKKTVCNMDYLVTKSQAFSFQFVVNELESLRDKFPEDEEIGFLHEVFSCSLVKSASQIPVHLLARVDREIQGKPHLQSLAKQAMAYAKTSDTPLLLPAFDFYNKKCDVDYAVTSCDTNSNKQFVVTNSGESFTIWGLQSWTKHIAAAPADMTIDEIKLAVDDTVLLGWEKSSGKLAVWDFTTGKPTGQDFGSGVLRFILNDGKKICYLARQQEKGIQVETWDIKSMENRKTISLKKFNYPEFDLLLTASEEFLVFLIQCDQAAQDEIATQTKKALGGYKPHVGHLRFAAVSLKEESPSIRHCYRPLSKVPFLGNCAGAVSGNKVVIGLQVTMVFWHLDSGKCDGLLVNGNRGMGQFFRPHWTEPKESAQGCTTHIERSADYKHAIVGSEDGWALVYELQTGVTVGWKNPKAKFKHEKPIAAVGISNNGEWAASASLDGVLKLWKVTPGKEFEEAFNIQLELVANRLHFSTDGDHLVVTGTIQDGDDAKPQFCTFHVTHGSSAQT